VIVFYTITVDAAAERSTGTGRVDRDPLPLELG
jgi:hypothetical protein